MINGLKSSLMVPRAQKVRQMTQMLGRTVGKQRLSGSIWLLTLPLDEAFTHNLVLHICNSNVPQSAQHTAREESVQ